MGRSMGSQRFATYIYGHCMVVRGPRGNLAQQEARWKTQAEYHPRNCHSVDWIRYECASAGIDAEYDGSYGVWVYVDVGGRE